MPLSRRRYGTPGGQAAAAAVPPARRPGPGPGGTASASLTEPVFSELCDCERARPSYSAAATARGATAQAAVPPGRRGGPVTVTALHAGSRPRRAVAAARAGPRASYGNRRLCCRGLLVTPAGVG